MTHRAFTLIELLIVVAIIGILAAIAVPNFLNARLRATITRVQSDMLAFEKAYEMYRLDKNSFPPHISAHPRWQNKYVTTPIAYLNSIPQDPFQMGMGKSEGDYMMYSHGEFHVDPCPGGRLIQNPALYARVQNCRVIWSVGEFLSVTASYFISPGPSMKIESDDSMLFEISNGLDSPGDIVRVVGP